MKCISSTKIIFGFIFNLLFLFGCNSTDTSTPKADVSDIKIDLKIYRFDQALFAIPPDSIPTSIQTLEKDFGTFFRIFGSDIIHIGETNQRDFGSMLQKFVSDFNMQTAYQQCQNKYNNISTLTSSLTEGFKHYKYYFKEKNIPDIYFYMGGFNQSIITSDSLLGIGLEKYLGNGCDFYSRLGLASYQVYKMQEEFILPDCFKAMAWSEFPYVDSIDNLASNMIYQGKVQYFMDLMLPNSHDTIKFEFTGKQWEWCLKNEKTMWAYFIDKKQLFTTVQMDIKRYIDEAPFTSTFPHESPGRTGVWIGWRMVKKYMELNPEISLKQLMLDNDYQKIMNSSKYNP